MAEETEKKQKYVLHKPKNDSVPAKPANEPEKKKVVVANVTGKDAVSMLVRPSGTQDWSDNVLSQDYFHSNKALELSYVEKAENIYDIRLVFEDGSYEDFTNLDYSKTIGYIYLGNEEPSAEETT